MHLVLHRWKVRGESSLTMISFDPTPRWSNPGVRKITLINRKNRHRLSDLRKNVPLNFGKLSFKRFFYDSMIGNRPIPEFQGLKTVIKLFPLKLSFKRTKKELRANLLRKTSFSFTQMYNNFVLQQKVQDNSCNWWVASSVILS